MFPYFKNNDLQLGSQIKMKCFAKKKDIRFIDDSKKADQS